VQRGQRFLGQALEHRELDHVGVKWMTSNSVGPAAHLGQLVEVGG
jgi:hypothetical protein